jgi:hypothetical protein
MDDVQQIIDEAEKKMHAPGLSPTEREKARLRGIVERCASLVTRDRRKVLEQLDADSARITEDVRLGRSANTFLPLPTEELAARLWDGWSEEERAEIVVEVGYYILDRKAWFRVVGVPELVEEPAWSHIIDPMPLGIGLYADGSLRPANIRVVDPMSPDSRLYAAVEGVVRPQKAQP